jgi:hypothetical protein
VFRFLAFLLFFVVLAGGLVFLVVPVLVSPALTQYVRDMGVEADDLKVSVDTFDPALLSGRAGHVRVEGTNVQIGRATVRQLDLTLGDVSFFDRSFGSVEGQLDDVAVVAGGISASADEVHLTGPAGGATATGRFGSQQSEDMIMAAARRVGVPLDDARLVDGGLRVTVGGGIEVGAGISVEGGALILRPHIGPPILLLQPATSDPWRLEEAYVSPAGIIVRGTVDASRLAQLFARSR